MGEEQRRPRRTRHWTTTNQPAASQASRRVVSGEAQTKTTYLLQASEGQIPPVGMAGRMQAGRVI